MFDVQFEIHLVWVTSLLPENLPGLKNIYSGLRELHELTENEQMQIVFTTKQFLEVAIESWSKWDLNPRPLNSAQTHIYIYNKYMYINYIYLVMSRYLLLLSSIVTWIIFWIKLLQTPLMVPYFEKYCPLIKGPISQQNSFCNTFFVFY